MSQTEKQECLWVGTARIDDMQFVAIGRKKPKSAAFAVAIKSFHLVPLKELDFLYKTAKNALLSPGKKEKRRK